MSLLGHGTRIPDFARTLLALPPEGSTFASAVDGLHLLVIGVTMLGAIAVALRWPLLALFAIARESRGQLTPRVVGTLPVELGLAATTLALFLAFWFIGFRQFIDIESRPNDAMVVYVTAKQWMWKFQYPGGRASNDVLVVPAGRAVKLVMTSRDVIHSFYVPASPDQA